VTIPDAGVYPHIRKEILPNSSQDRGKKKPSAAPSSSISSSKATKASMKSVSAPAATSSLNAGRGKAKGKAKKVQDDGDDGDDGEGVTAGHGRAEVAGRLAAHKFSPLGSRILPHGQKLTVVQGNIVYAEVDAIVHPTNSGLSLGGMVGHEIGNLEGNEFTSAIQSHVRNHGNLQTSGAAVTPAFRLPCSHVIHVNSPTWGEDDARGKLERTIHNLLDCAEKGNMRSVALPSIGSGNNGFPKATAANVILESIAGYFAEHRNSAVKEVVFVLFDNESVEVYKHEFARLVTN
jgi:histone H2A